MILRILGGIAEFERDVAYTDLAVSLHSNFANMSALNKIAFNFLTAFSPPVCRFYLIEERTQCIE